MVFKLHAKVGDKEVTPSTIGISQFNSFNREVEKFLAGSEPRAQLDQVHVAVEEGSYALAVFLSVATASMETDLERLSQHGSLKDIDPHRAAIVKNWQDHARAEEGFSVSIQSDKAPDQPIYVSRDTDFHLPDQDEWVSTEKYIVGRLVEVGGSARVNVHLVLEDSGKTLIAASTEEYLRGIRQNYLYQQVQLHIAAEENIHTGALRKERLLAFVGEGPSYDEQELNAAIEKGTKAWADVPDSVAWLREQRGSYDD